MIERPVLQHAQVALDKAERFAELSVGTPDDRFERHPRRLLRHVPRRACGAARGRGSATTTTAVRSRPSRVWSRTPPEGRWRARGGLEAAFKLRMKADYGDEDLTEEGRKLRALVGPLLAFWRKLVDAAGPAG